MRLEPTPRPEQTVRVSARLITSSTILHLSAEDLERAVNQEQIENPAFEAIEHRVCLFCGTPMQGQNCPHCGHAAQSTPSTFTMSETATYDDGPQEPEWGDYHQYEIPSHRFIDDEENEEFDPMASIPMGETLAESLLHQLETLITPDDAPIAEQLIGNLNERGYLEMQTQEIAEYLQMPLERVEYVLSQLHTLEPSGIGARDLRECLLLQLEALSEQETPHPLAEVLIDRYLDRLGRSQFSEIARALKVPEQTIRQGVAYIRSNLHPFPAHAYISDERSGRSSSVATYIRPDVLIRRGETGFEVELIEEKHYRFRISTGYGTRTLSLGNEDVQRYMHGQSDRARFFIECIHRRWQTLKRVMELVVDYQHEFLEKGVRYLRPLTRAEVATRLNLDEGTVSRATANKYTLLPNGRLIPIADFFDGSLGVKDVLRELILAEEPGRRLSDEELARLLMARGIAMARRTVTKYREEMGIASSRER